MPRKRERSEERGGGEARSRGAGRERSGKSTSGEAGKPRRGRPERGGRAAAGQRREPSVAASEPVRLQVFLARAGVASRRASEELIRAGRVTVNGQTVTEMGTRVRPERDRVYLDGRRVQLAEPVWIALHKPKGYVTTRDDPSGRRTIYDLLPPELHSLFHVGRLDRISEGLLLLTNEGEVANRLLHPRYGILKEYVVVVEGVPEYRALKQLVEGVEAEGGETLYAESVEILELLPEGQSRLRLELREGRNREVRRMLEALGFPVKRLVRKRFGPIALGKMRRGEWRYLTPAELELLRASGRDDDSSSS